MYMCSAVHSAVFHTTGDLVREWYCVEYEMFSRSLVTLWLPRGAWGEEREELE